MGSAPAAVRVAALAFAVVVFAAWPGTAAAHQTSVKPVTIAVDGASARVEVRAAAGDVVEALDLPPDATPTPAQIAAGAPRVSSLVADWVSLGASGQTCRITAPGTAVAPDDARFVLVHWTAICRGPIRALTLDFGGLFEIDPTQSIVLTLTAPDASPFETIVAADQSPLTVTLGEHGGALAFIRHGIDHILYGYDHVAFVLALLLVVILGRDLGEGSGWRPRGLGEALRKTATIVTSFTIAHSLTLIAASMGWVHLPSRLVESLIAVSIAYTAIENIVRPDVRWRFVLTFGFGLMHGLGFAGVLADLLPPDDVLPPLLAFNVGVELGQLLIVLAALPALALICRAVGAARYRRIVMPALSSVIALLGLLWLVERAFAVKILGF